VKRLYHGRRRINDYEERVTIGSQLNQEGRCIIGPLSGLVAWQSGIHSLRKIAADLTRRLNTASILTLLAV
jgi:hypothetical protein